MPHGQSWLTLILGHFYDTLHHNAGAFNKAVFGKATTLVADEEPKTLFTLHFAFVLLLLVVIALLAQKKLRSKDAIIPDAKLNAASFLENFTSAIYGLMSDIMGKKAARFFLPLIGTCAFLIFFSNFLGMVPGMEPPTGTLNTTLVMGLVIFLATHIFGFKEQGIAYAKHFLGPVVPNKPVQFFMALPLMLLMLVIEGISHSVRPISLAFRLMANMFADHLVLSIFMALLPILVPVPLLFLGTIVCVVQTMVFCILSTIYIKLSIEHHEEHDDHGGAHDPHAHVAHT